ncbi:3-coathanger stack domain-containing protein [Emticicia sp.]|uniref:Ig-like domain-containing protein n=1 Tax=Emticicia sp. TaxID=1930953 RepID=UPI003750F26B
MKKEIRFCNHSPNFELTKIFRNNWSKIILTLAFAIPNHLFGQLAIQLDTATVREGTYRAIGITPSGASFSTNTKFYLSVRTKITFSATVDASSPKYINEFTNESLIEECRGKRKFCYEAPIQGIYPIVGDNRVIWNVETIYSVFSASPYLKVDFVPTISVTGSNNKICSSCDKDTLQILNLSEVINKNSYEVPREATVHHYFLVKNKKNEPVKDVLLKYQINGRPEIISSPPSDKFGLVDLTVKVGGGNVENSSDDKILAGTQKSLSFVDAAIANVSCELLSNAFSSPSNTLANNGRSSLNNDLTISVIEKAPKIKEEFGMSAKDELEFSVKSPDLQLPGVKAKIGGSSVGFGITSNPALIINPKSATNWSVIVSTPLGLNVKAKVAANIKVSNEIEVGLGEFKGKLAVNTVGEYGYDIDLNSRYDCFFLGSKTFLLFAPNPFSFLAQTYLERLSRIIDKSITSDKNGFNLEIEAKGSVGLTSFKLFTPKSKENKFEVFNGIFNLSARLDANINIESNDEFSASDGTFTTTNRITALKENNTTVEIGLGGGVDKMVNQIKFTPFKWSSNSEKFQVSLKKNTDEFPSSERKTNYGIIEFSTEKAISIAGSEYKIANINNFKYSGRVLQKLESKPILTATNAPYSNLVLEKSVFPVLSLASNIVTDGTNIYKQIFDFNDIVFQNFDDNWNENDVVISNRRKITKVSNNEFEIEIPLSPTYSLKKVIGYKAWNSYQHHGREYSNVKDFDSLLMTTDYPDIESNLELPNSYPMIYFWTKLSEGLFNSTTEEKQFGNQFITSKEETVSNSPITLSNSNQGQVSRLSLDAKQIGSQKDKSANTNETPSVFTFTIPPASQAFNSGTKINFLYYYPENQLDAKTSLDTFKLITDTFFLDAIDGTNKLSTAPNGNFTINTQFSNYELKLAGLAENLVPRVLFLPNGSEVWEDIGAANQTINFNRLGIFALGVGLQNDYDPPIIVVTPPPTFTDNNSFTITLIDNASGIDWSKTSFICNGALIPIVRNGTSNTFTILIADVPKISDNTFNISIYTSDLALHKQEFHQIYPCASSISFVNIVGSSFIPINKHQASQTIEVSGSSVIPPSIELKAGKSIMLSPGFNTDNSGGYFKAEIGGCNSSIAPAQPANFTVSSSVVCNGQTGVVYTIPNEAGVTYNWSYSGTGATLNGTSNSITINFANNATSGNLSVTATNNAGTSPSRILSIITNSPSSPPTTTGKSIGIGTSTSLSATGCTTYKWYDQATNGTLLFTGNIFVTPTLNANTTYYVACSNSPCSETTRTSLLISVGSVPTQPSPIVGGGTACQGRSGLTYLVTAVAGATSYTWTYSGTGVTFVGGINNTRTITLDFSYTATSGILSVTANNAYGSSTAQTMSISASPAPNAPTASGMTISSGNSANLTATGCSTYKWYSQATLGTATYTGQNFTTPTLNSTTTYYVACNNGTSCESPRVAVTVTIP